MFVEFVEHHITEIFSWLIWPKIYDQHVLPQIQMIICKFRSHCTYAAHEHIVTLRFPWSFASSFCQSLWPKENLWKLFKHRGVPVLTYFYSLVFAPCYGSHPFLCPLLLTLSPWLQASHAAERRSWLVCPALHVHYSEKVVKIRIITYSMFYPSPPFFFLVFWAFW